MLQGVGARGMVWAPQVERLRERYSCITVDNRGVGDSGEAPGTLVFGQMVDDAIALLDHLQIDRAHVIGHSMGGILAHQLALDHPDRAASLGLLCTFTNGSEAARLSPRGFWLGTRTVLGTPRMRRSAYLRLIAPASELRGDLDAVVERYTQIFGHDLAQRRRIVVRQIRAMDRHDQRARLPELRSIPSIVLAGAEDLIAEPRYNQALAQAIGARHYHCFEDAAHTLPITHADAVSDRLAQHWAAP
ncbi:3-oxoadipate enol-lactonase 2 [Enhygromyxa salina]|uniref:3-oxoadipate enol-lactonase 2 n=2 Tax=Enhygromyxa salina TaxID=215803 RepID=A0A2S9Y4B9_9BACT|nr:3-oxoadipate enol-lactonase 2 [Enhygromyxa salina]